MADPKPFLRWAGGKTKLLPELLAHVPASIQTYYEPFLGGGALFFALRPKKAVLSDINPDLVQAYISVRDDVERLLSILKMHAREHTKRGKDYYLKVRALNTTHLSSVEWAARAIYLNKTCFNGLWRVNKKGIFNVPLGKFKTPPKICDEENLLACSEALKGAEIYSCSFDKLIPASCQKGDFVYLDPPYVPLSKMSDFTAYSKEGFGSADQLSLSIAVKEIKKKKVDFILSNAGCPEVKELYKDFKIEEVLMRRNINSKADLRGHVVEYLVSGK